MFFNDSKQYFSHKTTKNITSNVHQIYSSPLVDVLEVPYLCHRCDLALVPFLKVQVIISKFKNEFEVNFQILWIHVFEGVGGYAV